MLGVCVRWVSGVVFFVLRLWLTGPAAFGTGPSSSSFFEAKGLFQWTGWEVQGGEEGQPSFHWRLDNALCLDKALWLLAQHLQHLMEEAGGSTPSRGIAPGGFAALRAREMGGATRCVSFPMALWIL